MINKILMGILKLIIGLVTTILTPIDNIITSMLPSLGNALAYVGNFLSVCTQSIAWVISLFGLPNSAVGLLVLFYGFKLTAPLAFYLIKLALAWYNKLKP